ncbi:unnamed protein product [Diatraea saccharalis]|uniref:FP protein C-terminal domain-containing protein n=1 Tax=Diatraea saccharalis TaxID=40085 RepID=A0A9N9R6U3_9NEOP|nr:unnamed protein product [Diatraea saccharalis]
MVEVDSYVTDCSEPENIAPKKAKLGKHRLTKYYKNWQNDYNWLCIVTSDKYKTYCKLCKKTTISRGGLNDVVKHLRTSSHSKITSSRAARNITIYFQAPGTSTSERNLNIMYKTSAAEITSIYHTVQHSLSYNSMECFQKLLPFIICKEHYDLICANVSESRFYNTLTKEKRETWKCTLCVSKQPRTDNTNTPVRSAEDKITTKRGAATTSPHSQLDISMMDINCENNTPDNSRETGLSGSNLDVLIYELRLFREELSTTRRKIGELNVSLSNLVSRIDACETTIDKLNARVEKLEQQQKGENLTNIAITLAKKLGVNIGEQEVVCAMRVGRPPGQVDASSSSVRPRTVVIRLARRAVRDEMLQAARVRRGVTTEGTGLPGTPRRFYVNERLTRVNRSIYRRARDIAGRLNWRFVWSRDGRVFVRQHQGDHAPRHRLRSEADLVRVFGPNAVHAVDK